MLQESDIISIIEQTEILKSACNRKAPLGGSFSVRNKMMPGSKGLNPHELAHRWVKDLGTGPDMSIKVGCISHDMRILDRIVRVRSTEQSVGIIVGVF